MVAVKVNRPPVERIILGIDPGTNVLGYGVLKVCGRDVSMVAMGVIDLRKCSDVYLKLGRIYERVMGIIDSFLPDELAIEAPFFGKNVQSMLKLGRAQGVAIAAAISRDIPIHEYAPLEIKKAITGNGQASKEQVAEMLKRILKIKEENILPYCHYLSLSKPERVHTSSSRSWSEFVRNNTGRVHGDLPEQETNLKNRLCRK